MIFGYGNNFKGESSVKNQRLVKALKEMNKARELAWSAWSASLSASSAYWSTSSAYWSASLSASRAVKTNEKEVLKILKSKLTAKEQKNEINN